MHDFGHDVLCFTCVEGERKCPICAKSFTCGIDLRTRSHLLLTTLSSWHWGMPLMLLWTLLSLLKEREEKKHSKGKKNSSNKITLDSSKKFNVDDKPKLDFMNAIVFEKDLEACSAEWCVDEEYMQGHTRSIELWSHQVEPCLGPTIS